MSQPRTIRAPRGTTLRCKGWPQEAALRMLMNNLDPDVAERPADLVVYGGTGKAARSWEAFDVIVRELERLGDDETLLVQSGKAVGVLQDPRRRAARAHRQLEPRAALGDVGQVLGAREGGPHHVRPDDRGLVDLHRHAGHPAGHLRDLRLGGARALRRRARICAGASSSRGAWAAWAARSRSRSPCAAASSSASTSIRRASGAASRPATSTSRRAISTTRSPAASAPRKEGRALSVGLEGNCARILPELVERGVVPDLVTDQTSAHDPLRGYVPAGVELAQAEPSCASAIREEYIELARRSMADHVRAMLDLKERGAHAFDYGNNLRGQAAARRRRATIDGFKDIPGFVPAYIRPLFCEGKGPFRWAALSGDPADIARHRRGDPRAVPRQRASAALAAHGRRARAVPGAAGAHLLARLRRARTRRGWRSTSSCAAGKVKAPIVIGRDHLDSGSVASPNRETEAMRDGSDAISDWVFLNALVNCAAGATWVSVHHGGGVGIGYSQHAGMVVVADGTDGGGAAARARAHHRSGDGRPAPRRRRLPRGARLRRGRMARACPMFGSDHRRQHRRARHLRRRRRARPRARRGRRRAQRARRVDRPVGGSPRAVRRRRRHRRRRAAGHARARRSAHAPRVRRLARARVRPAQPGPLVPRDPEGGRRHLGDGAGHARRVRRRARRRRAPRGSIASSPRA